MTIIGFNFTRIIAERAPRASAKLQITNNIALKNVQASPIGADETKSTVRVGFHFESLYQPNIARIMLDGDVLLLLEKKIADEFVKGYNEKKQVPVAAMQQALNHVLDRCNIQALLLAKDLNLPSPIPLPKVNVQTPGGAAPAAKAEEKKDEKKKAKK